MKCAIKIFPIILLAWLAACREHTLGQTHIDGDSKPRFRFVGLNVGSLVVYEVPDRYLKEGIPLGELKEDNPNTQWFLEGKHDAKAPILYGSAPPGMKEARPARPLREGVIYFASSYVGTRDTGAFVGQYFKISNGRAEEFHEAGNEQN